MIRTVKRILPLLFALLVLIPQTAGCRKTEDAKDITAEVKDNGTPLSELHYAPALTLACRGQETRAICFSAEWKADGAAIDACGMFMFEYYLNGDVEPLKATSGDTVEFRFETMPDRYEVRAWDAAGITADYDYSQANEYTEITVTDNRFVFPEEGIFLYQLHAEWDERDGVGGDAAYVFAVDSSRK